jgi:hypothetical protein
VRLPGRLPVATFAVTGATAPPRVTIAGPGGLHATTPADGSSVREGRFVILQSRSDRTTYIAAAKPTAGRWDLALEPGSSPVESVRTASGLSAPRVTAKVTGRGHARKLHFRVRPLRGQVVRFFEDGPETGRQLVRTTATRGTIHFRPGDGKAGRRSIIALVEQNGMVRRRLRVARFRAPQPMRPARPRRISLRRKGGRLLIGWPRAVGAERYIVGIRPGDGRRMQISTRKRSVRLRGIGSRESVRVEVTGVRGPYVGRPTRARRRGTR